MFWRRFYLWKIKINFFISIRRNNIGIGEMAELINKIIN